MIALLPATFAQAAQREALEYTPAPIDNPLKGLVPYAGNHAGEFPHSLEFNYIGFSELVKGPDEYNWEPLEKLLNGIAGRGHQAVIRIYLEFPGKTNVLPAFLIQAGLKVHKYQNTNTQPLPPSEIETPDYENAQLRTCLKAFIAAFGKRYDGDARIGFITAGLLGTWGEWHTYPREELFASKTVQSEVMDAYADAFKVTPVLLRYPAGATHGSLAANHARAMGYHDDSFAWGTLDTGKPSDQWFYMSALKSAGPEALAKWKTQPIGGEIRPEAWGKVFDTNPGDPNIQDFAKCVEATHASWVMDSGLFRKDSAASRRARAETQVRRMGYEFFAQAVETDFKDGALTVRVEVVNRGVAPFYYDWTPEIGLLDSTGLIHTQRMDGKLKGLLPGDAPRVLQARIEIPNLAALKYKVLLRVPNSLKNGAPIRFANTTQDKDQPGWLTLTSP